MVEESEIREQGGTAVASREGFHDFKELKTTALSRMWIAHKDGKRFLIKTTKDNSELQLRTLRREYELSAECDHPNIVHVYTTEQLPMGMGIVMEYIEGRTLSEFIAENPPKRERQRIFEELMAAVGYLHKRGIIHNDLKPDNILITRADNTLKLIDFGLADSYAEYALRSLGCTPHYASPELREHADRIDARSDIYSIGIIMMEMLGVSYIVRRCTNAIPAKRYANIEALQRSWHRYNRRWRVALNLLVAIIIASAVAVQTTWVVRTHRKESHRKELIQRMESGINEICNTSIEHIKASHYMEFAAQEVLIMWERCDSLNKAIATEARDEAEQAIVATKYGEIYQQRYLDAVAAIDTMPSFYIETDLEQIVYYDSLLNNRLRYTPYPSK